MSAPDQHRHSHSQEEVKERGNALARFAVDRRVTISMIAVGLIVLGYVSLTRLPPRIPPLVRGQQPLGECRLRVLLARGNGAVGGPAA